MSLECGYSHGIYLIIYKYIQDSDIEDEDDSQGEDTQEEDLGSQDEGTEAGMEFVLILFARS